MCSKTYADSCTKYGPCAVLYMCTGVEGLLMGTYHLQHVKCLTLIMHFGYFLLPVVFLTVEVTPLKNQTQIQELGFNSQME